MLGLYAYINFICIVPGLKIKKKPRFMQIGKLCHVVDAKFRKLRILGVDSIYLCCNLHNKHEHLMFTTTHHHRHVA